MVLGLRVGTAELVARRQQRDRRHDSTGGAVGQVAVGPQQHHRREGVGDVVDDVVEQCSVEVRHHRLHAEPPGQHAVGAVDDHRDQEEPEHRLHLALVGEVHHQQREHHAGRRVHVHGHRRRPGALGGHDDHPRPSRAAAQCSSVEQLGHRAGGDGAAALAHREAEADVHRDLLAELAPSRRPCRPA